MIAVQEIIIGEILKPQGLKGLVKVKSLTDDVSRFSLLSSVFVDKKSCAIEEVTFGNGTVFIKFSGVDDRNAAEALRGKLLTIDRADAIALDEDSYFVIDLIGCCVLDESGKNLGIITSIDGYGAADVITCIDPQKKEFRFPYLQHVVREVDIAKKIFCVFKKQLEEVAVFDD